MQHFWTSEEVHVSTTCLRRSTGCHLLLLHVETILHIISCCTACLSWAK